MALGHSLSYATRRSMKHIDKIKEKIKPILDQHQLTLVEIVWDKMGHQQVLSLSLADSNGTLDLDLAGLVSTPISEALDEITELDFEYILDIGSPGIERVLQSFDEIEKAKESYVKVTLKSGDSVEGHLIDVNQDEVTLKYFIKGRPKKSVFKFEEIEKIQLAVKF